MLDGEMSVSTSLGLVDQKSYAFELGRGSRLFIQAGSVKTT